MRKVKLTLQYRVPTWNFCTLDVPTANGKFSKELCRFCVSTRKGKYCSLYDEWLTEDPTFVHKTCRCIKATAGFAITADEPVPEEGPKVDPKLIMRETINSYKKTVNDLVSQGYPRSMAETIATKYLLDDK